MHRLALALGCTVSELSSRLSLKELVEWMSFYELEPWGSSLDGMRIAANTAAIYNTRMNMTKNSKTMRPQDLFIGVNTPKKKKMGWQEVKRRMRMIFPNRKDEKC